MKQRTSILLLLILQGIQAWLPNRSPPRRSALHAKSQFAQPAFSQAAHQNKRPQKKKSAVPQTDSKIGQIHQERIKTAGRIGTKRFVDPCKIFIGNLPFDADREAVRNWICESMGLPPAVLLNDVKVVMDWKTGQSKGYAFVDFTEAIYGTICLDKCNGRDFGGRAVRVDQGKKKQDENQVYVKKQKKPPQTEEEAAIQAGLEEAMDPEEYALIRRLDPDLLENTYVYNVDDDLLEEGDEDEDDNEGVDGFWDGDEEDEAAIVEFTEDGFTQPMNREQRRDAAKKTKRRKLPNKGFGKPTSD